MPAEAAEAVSADPTRFGEMAAQVQAALYDTNREIFADIYPALAMYKRHGLTGVLGGPGQCGGMRPDRVMPEELQLALKELDEGNVGDGSLLIAQYEQIRIVQERIYDDPARPLVKPAMRLNQAIAADPLLRRPARLLFGVAPPEVALSTECGDGTPGVSFPGDITVARDRVRYFERLNDAFASKPASWRRAALERIMRRDPLTGGPDY
ncbi:MAG: hypothetical protein MUF21_15250 [Gemmatimonadaceae bacterium]|nr:hypothetical protein [Gemmatimonadaceae bacterium]